MSSYKKYKKSRFLTKSDVEDEPQVTYDEAADQNVALPGEQEKIKPCIKFKELDKQLAANITQLDAIAELAGTDEMDEWPGTRLTLYWDPTVAYGPNITGGIRVRAPKKPLPKLVRKLTQPPVEQENGEEEIPI